MKYNPQTLLFTFLMLCLLSCEKEREVQEVTDQEPAVMEETQPELPILEQVVFRTTVDELRLREAPAKDSRVLQKLPQKQKLYSLDEASEETYTATMGGKKVTDVWRKVKVVSASGKEVVGWVFGGGVRVDKIEYELMPNGRYVREIDGMPGPEMAQLLGIDVFPEFDYGGRVSYRKTPTDLYLLDGPFEVIAVEEPNEEGFTKNISVTYLGQLLDGKLHGEVQRLYYGYESESKATILFDNGRCSSGLIIEEGEGMTNRFEEPEMATCTFRYLDDGLREKYSE